MNLLYPNGKENTKEVTGDTFQHLALNEIVDMIAVTNDDKILIRQAFSLLPTDKETVSYRQEIIRDFIENDVICDKLGAILGKLDVLKEFNAHNHFLTVKKSSLWDYIDYISEVDVYVQVVEELNLLFDESKLNSKGLLEISRVLKEVIDMDRINELKEVVKSQRGDLNALRSVLVGINLTNDLKPDEIRILEYRPVPFKSQFKGKMAFGLSVTSGQMVKYDDAVSPIMKAMAQDMENRLGKSLKKNKEELREYVNFKGYFLLDICNDLKTFLLLAKFGKKLKEKGYSFCYPSITDENEVSIKGVYNIRLTEKNLEEIVKNDFSFTEKEKVFILTGPNRGGKTMLTQAVGLAAFMAAQGLFVAADEYKGFLFNGILTHFPADENETLDMGRLGEEAVRVREIVKNSDSRTLVLLNETYSSTSSVDGLYLAKDLVHILKHKEVPTIFNTHIHDLARMTDEMNKWDGRGDVISLAMEIVDNVNTYKVLRKEPDTSSYARNIALRYNVTYDQMLEES